MGSSWAVRQSPGRFGSGPYRLERRCGMDHEIEQVTEELPEFALMVDIGDDDD
jgi:hypothetical protein